MSYLIKPQNYKPLLDLKQTELGIKQIKEFFQMNLSSELRLRRVTAPLFVLKGMGINDDLNGVERPVSFPIKDLEDAAKASSILLLIDVKPFGAGTQTFTTKLVGIKKQSSLVQLFLFCSCFIWVWWTSIFYGCLVNLPACQAYTIRVSR